MTLSDFAAMSEAEYARYMSARNARTLTPEQVNEIEHKQDVQHFTAAERFAAYDTH